MRPMSMKLYTLNHEFISHCHSPDMVKETETFRCSYYPVICTHEPATQAEHTAKALHPANCKCTDVQCPADLIDWPPSILHFVPASREDYQDVYISQTNSYHLFLHHSDVKSPFCGQSNWQTLQFQFWVAQKVEHPPHQSKSKIVLSFLYTLCWVNCGSPLSSIYQNLFLIIQRAHNTSNIFPFVHGLQSEMAWLILH